MSQRERDVWKRLVDEAYEEPSDRAASVSVERAEWELAAAGFDVAAERANASAFLDDLARPRRRPRPVVMWLAAAATVAAGGGLTCRVLQRTPPGRMTAVPSSSSVRSEGLATPDPIAAGDMRSKAAAACDAKQWAACLASLDRARAIDPQGDDAPSVKQLRARAVEGQDEPPR